MEQIGLAVQNLKDILIKFSFYVITRHVKMSKDRVNARVEQKGHLRGSLQSIKYNFEFRAYILLMKHFNTV